MTVETITATIENLRQQRNAASLKAGELQTQMNQEVIRVHQLDGAITALEDLLPKT